jgi:alcohol dehydrogenase class IV
MTIARFSFPTTIHFGPGARRLAGPRLRERGLSRALLVTDKGLAPSPLVADLKAELERAGLAVAVFGGVWGNPTAGQVLEAAAAFKAHDADCVVGVGGGAALDVAKIVGAVASQSGDVLTFAWDHPRNRPITGPLPCFVALPTTAGTGSEVGRSAVISDEDTHVKRIIFSPLILATEVFADPELTLGLPPAVTAATGMDALTHNVESYLSSAYHPLCDGIALEGTRIAARALLTAVREPGNLEARADMMMASMMGAVAFQKDLGAVHSCAHALGTVCDLHHGLANALMIDTVLEWNQEAVPHRFDDLAHAAGVAARGKGFVPWLRNLKRALGFPASLSAVGVRRDQVARLVEVASADTCHQTNPRPCTDSDFERFFLQAL